MRVFLTLIFAQLIFNCSHAFSQNVPEGNEEDFHLKGRQIIQNVNDRDDGIQVSRKFKIELTDRRGVTRVEETIGYRKYYDEQKRTVIFYTDPTNVRGTSFLTFDYFDEAKDDDQWLYLPALRRVRRISSSDRGDYFLGTDLTYEDIKKEGKYDLAEYEAKLIGEKEADGIKLVEVELIPKTKELQKELGYSRLVAHIDPEIWMSRKVEYWDTNGNPLKTLSNNNIIKIDSYWTVMEMVVENIKTNHKTKLSFSDVDYKSEIRDDMFSQQQMRRGLR